MTPTQRALKYYRDKGYICGIVEKWNPHAKIRQDLFGFIDLIAVPEKGFDQILAIQCTSGANHAARRTKICQEHAEKAGAWMRCAGDIRIISFRKGSNGRYSEREEVIQYADLHLEAKTPKTA